MLSDRSGHTTVSGLIRWVCLFALEDPQCQRLCFNSQCKHDLRRQASVGMLQNNQSLLINAERIIPRFFSLAVDSGLWDATWKLYKFSTRTEYPCSIIIEGCACTLAQKITPRKRHGRGSVKRKWVWCGGINGHYSLPRCIRFRLTRTRERAKTFPH